MRGPASIARPSTTFSARAGDLLLRLIVVGAEDHVLVERIVDPRERLRAHGVKAGDDAAARCGGLRLLGKREVARLRRRTASDEHDGARHAHDDAAGELVRKVAAHKLDPVGRHGEEDDVGALRRLRVRDELVARRARAEHDLLAETAKPLGQALAEVACASDDADHASASSSRVPTSARRSGSTITIGQTTDPLMSLARS